MLRETSVAMTSFKSTLTTPVAGAGAETAGSANADAVSNAEARILHDCRMVIFAPWNPWLCDPPLNQRRYPGAGAPATRLLFGNRRNGLESARRAEIGKQRGEETECGKH